MWGSFFFAVCKIYHRSQHNSRCHSRSRTAIAECKEPVVKCDKWHTENMHSFDNFGFGIIFGYYAHLYLFSLRWWDNPSEFLLDGCVESWQDSIIFDIRFIIIVFHFVWMSVRAFVCSAWFGSYPNDTSFDFAFQIYRSICTRSGNWWIYALFFFCRLHQFTTSAAQYYNFRFANRIR